MRTRRAAVALVVLAVLGLGNPLRAAPPAVTTITVADMHCVSCAKKMATNLYEVPGVAEVKASVPTTTLTVTPQGQTTPSPRALWEAVERAGYTPSRLEGPSGTFTRKPQS